MTPENKKLSRRDFIKDAGIGGISTLVSLATGGLVGNLMAQDATPTETPKPEIPPMPKRPFGKTGVNVSILAVGGITDFTTNQIILKKSLDWGINYWDTADCYNGGNSEIGIGQFFEKNPDARKKVFLVSKSCERSLDGMSKLLARSFERMKTDYIDLYFIHGISNIKEMAPEMKGWAEKMKKEGKIKFFGFSAHKNMAELLQMAPSLGFIDGIMMTYNYRIMHKDDMKKGVEECQKAGIGLTAMKTQGGGQVKTDTEEELKLAGQFIQKGYTPHQAKLKAVWQNPAIATICSAMYNLTVLSANVAAAVDNTKLELSDLMELKTYAAKNCSGYCAGCASICDAAMGRDSHIADVMRYVMYQKEYGDAEMARREFASLPEDVRYSLRHLDFAAAERACPQKMPIGKIMREAADLLA